jgi:hypothetical protein
MIYPVQCFSAKCNGCGADFEDGNEGWVMFQDESSLSEMMEESEWYLTYDGTNKHYCPDCHNVDEDGILILKGKALISPDKPIEP